MRNIEIIDCTSDNERPSYELFSIMRDSRIFTNTQSNNDEPPPYNSVIQKN